jgi:hypothetical protein
MSGMVVDNQMQVEIDRSPITYQLENTQDFADLRILCQQLNIRTSRQRRKI